MTPIPSRHDDARSMFEAGVRAVQADRLLTSDVLDALDQDRTGPLRVVAIGKAALAMAGTLEAHVGDRIRDGVAVVPHGYPDRLPEQMPRPARVEVRTAGHPVPDADSVRAGRRCRHLAAASGPGDTLVALISGGGSALMVDPPEGVPLAAVQHTVEALLKSGAPIQAINAVRKHLSRIKGGHLARLAAPARVLALVVSDVVGNDLATIASGPTVPDPSTFGEAIEALHIHGIWSDVPEAVRRHLTAGRAGAVDETPKPGAAAFDRVDTRLLATNRTALQAAARSARERGYAVHLLADDVTGEAREVARSHVRTLRRHAGPDPVCCLWGGEPTVTVTGAGTGGRSQELALAAALALDGLDVPATLLCGGTDGIDGPTDAAGAWATPQTARRARRRGLDPQQHLDANDAYPLFDALGQLLHTGPTHTNVMDLHIGVVGGAR